MFSDLDIKRYQRQINVPEIGLFGQKRLRQAKVLCIGLGGLGSPLCLYLAACGIGQLGLIDADQIDISNLHRQILYYTNDCGKSKTEAAKVHLQQINPNCQFQIYNEYLTEKNACNIIDNYDIIADCSDNFFTRYLVNDACVKLNKNYVMASVEKFQGQLAIFSGKEGPCYRCLFEKLDPYAVPNCNQMGVLGTTPGVLGMLQANEILKLILKIGEPMIGKLILISLLSLSTKIFKISKNPQCPSCMNLQDFSELQRPHFYCDSFHTMAAITIEKLNELIYKKSETYLIDVRSFEEYQKGHLSNAINVPLPELINNAKLFNKKKIIIVYCETSPRSIAAYQQLKQFGFQEVYYLEGGYSNAIRAKAKSFSNIQS